MNCYGLPGKRALSTSNSSFGKQLAGITAAGTPAVRWISCPIWCSHASARCSPEASLLSLGFERLPVPWGCWLFAPRGRGSDPVLRSHSVLSALICAGSLFPSSPLSPRCLPGSPDPLLPPGFLRVVWLFAQGCLRLLLKLLLASPVA